MLVGDFVIVGVPVMVGVLVIVGVAVEATGLEGVGLLHPPTKAAEIKTIMIKLAASFFTFTSPDKKF